MLHQLGQVSYFWKQGQQASFLLETQQNGEANLSLRFHLPKPHSSISPSTVSASHPTQHNQPIPPLFPNGQIPRSHNTHLHPRPNPPTKRSPSYYRQNYRRGVLYRAAKAAPNLPMPQPNSLRELAARALNSRKQLIQVISDTETPEQLRDQVIFDSSQLQEISDTGSEAGEERLEASLELENRQVEAVKNIDWSEEIEKEEDCEDEGIGQHNISINSTPGSKDYNSEDHKEDETFSSQIEENNNSEEEPGHLENKEEMAEVLHVVNDVTLVEWNIGGDTSQTEKVDGTLVVTCNKTSMESWLEVHSEKLGFQHKRRKIQTEIEYYKYEDVPGIRWEDPYSSCVLAFKRLDDRDQTMRKIVSRQEAARIDAKLQQERSQQELGFGLFD